MGSLRQALQTLGHQDTDHHLGGIGWTSTFAPIAALQQVICQRSQLAKVNVTGYDLQGISSLIEVAFTAAISKQIELQGTAWADHV